MRIWIGKKNFLGIRKMQRIDSDTQRLRQFGITLGIVFMIVTVFIILRKHNPQPALSIALIFFILGTATPILLKPLYIAWMRFTYLLGWVNTRLLLVAIFYLIFMPLGLVMRLCGIDSLKRRINKKEKSYWEKRGSAQLSYEKQF